jgi:hypothetical protein
MAPKNPNTAELRELFVSNLKRWMGERGLTTLETAQKAAIPDKKRFYRWASKGIARATHEHQQDLERLKTLFELPSVGAFWQEGKMLSLHERIEEAGKVDWTYEYAFKLLVALKSEGKTELKDLLEVVDGVFSECTTGQGLSAANVLDPRTPIDLLSYIQINSPAAYKIVMDGVEREQALEYMGVVLENNKGHLSADHFIGWILTQTESPAT